MGRKSKISHEIKIQIVEDYLAGKISLKLKLKQLLIILMAKDR